MEVVAQSPLQTERVRHGLVLLLTVNSGYTDAIGFLALGSAFTSVMTGNIVLLGLSVTQGGAQLAQRTASAILSYIVGCAIGARLAGQPETEQGVWPHRVTRALAVELGVYGAFSAGWWVARAHPHGSAQIGLLCLDAIALGVQSSAVQRFGVSGLSTTYMTGTLTTMVARIAAGEGLRAAGASAQLLLGLLGGAAVGAVVVKYARGGLPVVQLAILAAVLVAALMALHPAARRPADDHELE